MLIGSIDLNEYDYFLHREVIRSGSIFLLMNSFISLIINASILAYSDYDAGAVYSPIFSLLFSATCLSMTSTNDKRKRSYLLALNTFAIIAAVIALVATCEDGHDSYIIHSLESCINKGSDSTTYYGNDDYYTSALNCYGKKDDQSKDCYCVDDGDRCMGINGQSDCNNILQDLASMLTAAVVFDVFCFLNCIFLIFITSKAFWLNKAGEDSPNRVIIIANESAPVTNPYHNHSETPTVVYAETAPSQYTAPAIPVYHATTPGPTVISPAEPMPAGYSTYNHSAASTTSNL